MIRPLINWYGVFGSKPFLPIRAIVVSWLLPSHHVNRISEFSPAVTVEHGPTMMLESIPAITFEKFPASILLEGPTEISQ